MSHHGGNKASVVRQSTSACDLINKCQPGFKNPSLVAQQWKYIQEIISPGPYVGDFQTQPISRYRPSAYDPEFVNHLRHKAKFKSILAQNTSGRERRPMMLVFRLAEAAQNTRIDQDSHSPRLS